MKVSLMVHGCFTLSFIINSQNRSCACLMNIVVKVDKWKMVDVNLQDGWFELSTSSELIVHVVSYSTVAKEDESFLWLLRQLHCSWATTFSFDLASIIVLRKFLYDLNCPIILAV